jgi:ERCC4-type nuclease
MLKIVVDKRERNGPIPFMESKVSQIPNLTWEEKTITIGDFHIMQDDIIQIIIERKTWADLSASIIDERIDNQINKMIEFQKNSGVILLFIIEGKKNSLFPYGDKQKHGVSTEALNTKIRKISLQSIPCLFTKSAEDTVDLLIALTKDICKMNTSATKQEIPKFELTEKQQADLMFEQIPGIGKSTSTLLLEHTSFGNFLRLTDDGVKKLLERIPKKLGTKKIQQLMDVRENKNIDISIKILTCINGIGVATAKIILQKYSLSQLANINVADLQELMIDTKKLGNKRANRIVNVLNI